MLQNNETKNSSSLLVCEIVSIMYHFGLTLLIFELDLDASESTG